MDNERSDAKEILFQYIMNYKAYRRKMVTLRVILTVLAAGGLAGVCAVNIPLGITLALIAAFAGAISVLVAFHREWTYTVYNGKIVIKNKDKRSDIPLENIISVTFKTAFYEKDLFTGTATVTAKTAKGGKKKYKLRHIFDAREGVEFLQKIAAENATQK